MSADTPGGEDARAADRYPPELFRRADESDDSLFYAEPRLVVHIDAPAIAAIGEYFRRALPPDAALLDLMSSWRSHLPDDFPARRLIGLGMNAVELAENPRLHDRIVHDLNADPRLPLDDGSVDAAMVTVSIQYLTRPVEVFAEVNRVLKPGGAFHVIYSNRMFPTKAVAVWQALDDRRRAALIGAYFADSGGWGAPKAMDISPRAAPHSDPVYAVAAAKLSA